MTTESKQDTRRRGVTSTSGVLPASVASVVLVVLLVVLGGARDGSPGVWGAVAGGGIACLVFAFGTTCLHLVAGAMPSASLLVALMTYTLQLAVMALVVAILNASGAAGDTVSRGWFAVGVITVTGVWVGAQLWHATHMRLPAYDLGGDETVEGSRQSEAGAA